MLLIVVVDYDYFVHRAVAVVVHILLQVLAVLQDRHLSQHPINLEYLVQLRDDVYIYVYIR